MVCISDYDRPAGFGYRLLPQEEGCEGVGGHILLGRITMNTPQHPSSIITVGPIRLDTLHHEVSVAGKTSRLTPIESKVLHFLAVNVNKVCTVSQIGSHVWEG